LNQRQWLPLSTMGKGQYVVRVRSAGFNVAQRFVID